MRRRNSNPGAKSSTFIFTETARLGWVGEKKDEDQLQGCALHPKVYLPFVHHHSNSSPPSPASSRIGPHSEVLEGGQNSLEGGWRVGWG